MYPKLLQLPDTSDSFCNVKITTLDARVGVEFNLDADTPMIITDFVNPSALGPDTSSLSFLCCFMNVFNRWSSYVTGRFCADG